MVSPCGISQALTALANGLKGSAREQLMASLPLNPQTAIPDTPQIWFNTNLFVFGAAMQPTPAYRAYFGSSPQSELVPMIDSKKLEEIKQTIARSSNGYAAFPDFPAGDPRALYIVNINYFKDQWATPVDPRHTKKATFTNDDNSMSDVPTMHLTDNGPLPQRWSSLSSSCS